MPTLPWRAGGAIEPGRSYTAMVSYLPVKRFRTIPRFLWYVWQIQKQLKHAPGLVEYTLEARLLSKEFFTLSAWESEAALRRFVEKEPHRVIMARLAGVMGRTEFQFWQVKGAELPLTFETALPRLTSQRGFSFGRC